MRPQNAIPISDHFSKRFISCLDPGPQTPDVDGNYTEWSQWTQCSKTCGGGEKTRERSCSNPAPQGNGQPCEGEPEETVVCNKQECEG